jgi:uncharacterized membrane protein
MTLYQTLLFAHVLGVVIWLGGSMVLYLMWRRTVATGDHAAITAQAESLRWFERSLAMPSALVVLLAGGWLMSAGDWPFEAAWLHVGMAGVFGAAGVSMLWTSRYRKRLDTTKVGLGMLASMFIILVAFWAMIVKPGM